MLKSRIAVGSACLFLTLTALGACKSTSGKTGQLDLHTRILIHESEMGSGKNLKVTVVDKRRHETLLKKDSDRKVKSGRALVTMDYVPSENLDSLFSMTATEAFQMQGYRTDGTGTGTERELTIYLTKLDLKLRKQLVTGELPKIQARLRSQVKISAVNRDKRYGQEYEFFIKKTYNELPNKMDREKILNYGLTQLLYQIQKDEKLKRFLTG